MPFTSLGHATQKIIGKRWRM